MVGLTEAERFELAFGDPCHIGWPPNCRMHSKALRLSYALTHGGSKELQPQPERLGHVGGHVARPKHSGAKTDSKNLARVSLTRGQACFHVHEPHSLPVQTCNEDF